MGELNQRWMVREEFAVQLPHTCDVAFDDEALQAIRYSRRGETKFVGPVLRRHVVKANVRPIERNIVSIADRTVALLMRAKANVRTEAAGTACLPQCPSQVGGSPAARRRRCRRPRTPGR